MVNKERLVSLMIACFLTGLLTSELLLAAGSLLHQLGWI